VVDDDGFDDLIDMGLAGDLVLSFWSGHEGRAKADGQIIGVHHVFITVLGQAAGNMNKLLGNQQKKKQDGSDLARNQTVKFESGLRISMIWIKK